MQPALQQGQGMESMDAAWKRMSHAITTWRGVHVGVYFLFPPSGGNGECGGRHCDLTTYANLRTYIDYNLNLIPFFSLCRAFCGGVRLSRPIIIYYWFLGSSMIT